MAGTSIRRRGACSAGEYLNDAAREKSSHILDRKFDGPVAARRHLRFHRPAVLLFSSAYVPFRAVLTNGWKETPLDKWDTISCHAFLCARPLHFV